jgi:hypothetical protein
LLTSKIEDPSIKPLIGDLLTALGKDGPVKNLNDSLILDFGVLLDHLEISSCHYLFDCLTNSILDSDSGKQYNNKMKLRIVELILKHFNFRDTREIVLSVTKSLVHGKFCKPPPSISIGS